MLHRTPSLRRLFFGALAVIGVPAMLVAFAAYIGLALNADAYLKLAEEVETEVKVVKDAHITIQELQEALKLLPYDSSGETRRGLPSLIEKVDQLFGRMRNGAFDDPDEAYSISLAEQAWQTLRAKLEGLPPRIERSELVPPLAVIEDQRRLLDDVMAHIEREIRQETAETAVARDRLMAFVAVALLVGVGAAVWAGALLRQAVLGPLDRLRIATDRIGEGELDYRLEPERHLEFESVRRTFNWMASELATQHQNLHSRAIHDGLTGLLNRDEFQRCLETELDHAQRQDHPLGLLMIDLDHFKAVNDTYGHLTGDQALVMAARAVRHVLRPSDAVARYGGEEFTVILHLSDGASAEKVAERILNQIRELEIRGPRGEAIRITASIGLAAFPDDAGCCQGLIERADQALYVAKRGGRNRIIRWSGAKS